MQHILTQIRQWPPTSTTVIGIGILGGLGCFMLTGSIEGAVAVAGIFKVLCPQDAAAVDTALAEVRKIATTPAP